MTDRKPLAAALLAVALLPGCSTPMVRHASPPPDWHRQLAAGDATSTRSSFPLPPPVLERLMRDAEMEIREAERAASGVMGAVRIEAWYPRAGRSLKLKWKPSPDGGEGWNNSPRLEIAAYEIQKWFLSPDEYVVPTTVARCIPLDAYAPIDPDAEANLPDARCVFGSLSVWLEDVEEPSVQLDESRFYQDPRYARGIAQYNLLTYLVGNRDTRAANQLISTDPESPRIYAIDNGISFGAWPYNFFRRHFDRIRVPALPQDAVDALRAVDAGDREALRVLVELRRDATGIYRETAASPAFDVERGVRLRDGVLQLGLTPSEIDTLERRRVELLRAVDDGETPGF